MPHDTQPPLNTYTGTARFYDLDNASIAGRDLPFYMTLARDTRQPILELGCGTGRVALSLLRQGHQVVGVDISLPMLAQFERKLAALPVSLRARARLCHADMADFSLGEQFDLIIVPFRSFQALTTRKRALLALAAIRRHLTPHGVCLIDLARPFEPIEHQWGRSTWQHTDPQTGQLITSERLNVAVDRTQQLIEWTESYTVRERDGKYWTASDNFRLCYYWHYQAQVLWSSAGYTIRAEYGDHRFSLIDHGSELIYLLSND